MRSTPHPDAASDAPAAAPTAAAPQAAPTAAAPEAAGHPLDDAVAQGKQWLDGVDLNQLVGQLPQSVRDLGTQVAGRVRGLSPTQQAVGAAALAFGLGLLVVRSRRNDRTADAKASGKYRSKFDGKPFKGRGKSKFAAS
ncbi:hypothetical protein ACFQ48_04055 [Hymenobacter caeli]|uniref:DUF3618 domain-containing protein n=1 Tax=Hymenobacter caeli TaxID=2735894 RepID=A0ABX2FLA3_9BACT|nr:hypothetical protein [Hymenobacter caeli]NRT17908.1 hypothetical protein [Hymenobacter caeli]